MSFILDALKKSEAERQRQSTPGIADVAEGRDGKSSPRWLWIVIGLLAINLLVLAVLLLRPTEEPPPRQVAAPVPAPAQPAETPAVEARDAQTSFSEMVSEAKRRTPAPVEEAPQPAAAETPAAEPEVIPQPAPQRSAPSTLTTAYPTFNELRASGAVQLPDLHLDIHVYGERAAERFVFINMSKYAEHATLSEGPTVSEIVPEGVILEYRGSEFLLPRQ